MPYELQGNCVHKKGNPKPLKCYDNKKQALAYLRALEANVPDAKELDNKADDCMKRHMSELKDKHPDMPHDQMVAEALQKCGQSNKKEVDEKAFAGLLTQAETNYVPLSGSRGKACANCRWYVAHMDHCHLVDDYPEPILATGYCDRWETVPTPEPIEQTPIPVVIVEPEMDMEMAMPTTPKGLLEFIRNAAKSLFNPAPASEPVFTVFKANDKKYWLARHTGKFIDREGEIIADKAHEEYVARVQKGLVPMPELWTRHKRGTRHGQADRVWKSGGFTLALGHFDDDPVAEQAYRFYEKNAGKIKLSHMFNYPKRAKQNGVYYAYNTIEITTLPDGAEAFPYTSFEEIQPMALTDKDREWIRGVGGDEMLKRAEAADAKAAADTKTLDEKGVESKGLDNFEGATIPPNPDVEALKTVQADIETRLKAVENLPEQIKTLTATVKALTEKVSAEMDAKNAALEKLNALEAQILEYKDLKPPASQSRDTLLNAREKSLLEQLLTQEKVAHSLSLVETLVVGQPTIATGDAK